MCCFNSWPQLQDGFPILQQQCPSSLPCLWLYCWLKEKQALPCSHPLHFECCLSCWLPVLVGTPVPQQPCFFVLICVFSLPPAEGHSNPLHSASTLICSSTRIIHALLMLHTHWSLFLFLFHDVLLFDKALIHLRHYLTAHASTSISGFFAFFILVFRSEEMFVKTTFLHPSPWPSHTLLRNLASSSVLAFRRCGCLLQFFFCIMPPFNAILLLDSWSPCRRVCGVPTLSACFLWSLSRYYLSQGCSSPVPGCFCYFQGLLGPSPGCFVDQLLAEWVSPWVPCHEQCDLFNFDHANRIKTKSRMICRINVHVCWRQSRHPTSRHTASGSRQQEQPWAHTASHCLQLFVHAEAPNGEHVVAPNQLARNSEHIHTCTWPSSQQTPLLAVPGTELTALFPQTL